MNTMSKDKVFIFAVAMIVIVLVVMVGASARSGATNGKSSTTGTGQAGGSSAPVVLTGTGGRPVPVSQQGTSNVAGSVSISNTTANPIPVSVQGQVDLGPVTLSNNVSNVPLPVSGTVQLDAGASGSLNNIESAINKMSFDSSGNLKTASGGGGASGPLASKGWTYDNRPVKGNQDETVDVTINGITTTINVSLVVVKAQEFAEIQFLGPAGLEFDVSGNQLNTNQVFALSQQIPINRFHVSCVGVKDCYFKVNLVGN